MGNPLPVTLSQECRKATQILNDFVDPVNGLDRVLPLSVLRKAKGFAIFSVFRIGFVLSARAGSGIVIARTDDGKWSAPAAIGIGGLGGGFNVGAEVTDFLIVLNSRSAVRSFMATGSLQLGGNLSLAVGPLGRSAEASGSVNSSGKLAAMFSYSRSKGLYGGVSVEGTVLIDREDANGKAYGRGGHTAKQILSGSIDVPAFAEGLIGTIERFTLAHTPVGDRDTNPYDDEQFFDYGEAGRARQRDRDILDGIDEDDGSDRFLEGRGEDRDRDRDRQGGASLAAGPSWSERLEQYQNNGGSGSGSGTAKGRGSVGAVRNSSSKASDFDLNDDFDRLGIAAEAPRRSTDSWTEAEKRHRNESETRNIGSYAFGSPVSSLTNAPPRTGSGASSVRKRPGIRQRSSSIASNLSFGSFGKKKGERNGSTPIPDNDGADFGRTRRDKQQQQDVLDPLDRELQSGSVGATRPPAHNGRNSSFGGSSSYAAKSASPSPFHPRHRTNSSMSVTGRNGWSTFDSSSGLNNDEDDELFGSGTGRSASTATATGSDTAGPTSSDPFTDLTAGLERKWTGASGTTSQWQPRWDGGYMSSTMRDTSTLGATNVPQLLASPSTSSSPFNSSSNNNNHQGTRSYSSQAAGATAASNRGTPTIRESSLSTDYDNHLGSSDFTSYDDDLTSNGGYTGSVGTYATGRSVSPPRVLERVVALYDFEAQEEGDLGFERGQVIAVTKKTQKINDWWQGMVEVGESMSRVGIFPASYTQPL